ncbi:MAG: sulfate transporter [Rhodanobacter sp. 68-29]|uniref:sulfite exporter TauE/SafE family protein n=1 Tax=Rhodanobacter sp. PCA2 TaxID=2006117 RepID=UPI00086F5C72|nr:sulfite exporter TauE/SafE family protein [Rhodanobacter sp. PCA2]MBA2078570.1 sulfate transporter [Rhodanobacter sp. PCA2]MBN8921679.1 sulfite exporter TauE/SafE family protein [Rhodanobacter sp.]ODV27817.1 MAG: sulfate transporter [Rhodanobacter sp. SCN 68-63]OJY61327.1 MAG: sulfate transporter [Rhodanobacter sp. 68-29]
MSPLPEFLTFAVVGALAQLVDGALGMAYGVTSAGLLLGLGMPPVMASASVHYAETFTCGASGLSHLAAGNVRRRLFLALAIPGVVGALLGVWLAVHMPASWMRIALTPYLLGMGLFLLLRGSKRPGEHAEPPRGTPLLGAAAGFVDAIGGGGWSALTATTLLARGLQPRVVIGSVHLAKCIVSIAASAGFLFGIGAGHVTAVLGLIAGGIVAAPFGAFFIRRIPARAATVLAGLAVLALGVNNAVRVLH